MRVISNCCLARSPLLLLALCNRLPRRMRRAAISVRGFHSTSASRLSQASATPRADHGRSPRASRACWHEARGKAREHKASRSSSSPISAARGRSSRQLAAGAKERLVPVKRAARCNNDKLSSAISAGSPKSSTQIPSPAAQGSGMLDVSCESVAKDEANQTIRMHARTCEEV